jgi:ribonucleotide monophosphatase NagD (HAD superfamily)
VALRRQAAEAGVTDLRTVYMIGAYARALARPEAHADAGGVAGDNPVSDVRGARAAGRHWVAILTRTGCYQGPAGSNDATDPADLVCDTVVDAWQAITAREPYAPR